MTRDDYLWDRSGEPDPEIAKLERALAPLAHGDAPLDLEGARARRDAKGSKRPLALAPRRAPMRLVPALAAAALVAVTAVVLWRMPRETGGWAVERLEGAPRIGSARLADRGRLGVGQWLVTDEQSRARVTIGEIGFTEVAPGSRVRLVRASEEEKRLALARGTIHAVILAPPRQFIVETPSATTVDLGCAYSLTVADDGRGRVDVTSGWVSFEWKGREAFIPAGAACETRPREGPGTPFRSEAPAALHDALERVDFGNDAARGPALDVVLSSATADDALTLWHLLARLEGEQRARVADRLATLVPLPEGVTREAVLRGDRAALDRWWGALGLGDVEWWRLWQREWSGTRG